MKKRTSWLVVSVVAWTAAFAIAAEPGGGASGAAAADSGNAVSLASPFTDHMVLQRDRPAPVWGWATPGAKVTVAFAGQSKTATAGADGKWFLTLDPLKGTFEPRELSVRSERGAIAITNVVVGDVWVCSGQSNMEMGLKLLNGVNRASPEDVARASQPGLRLFTAPKQFVTEPAARYLQNERPAYLGQWKTCTIRNAKNAGIWWGFSAVAFYFGLEIQSRAGVPIGLVVAAHGGTAAEAWLSPKAAAGLKHTPACPTQAEALKANPAARETMKGTELNSVSACYNSLLSPLLPMAVRGVIWYQGEHNTNGDRHYAQTLEALIADWRAGFEYPEMPFYMVQLCSIKGITPNPTNWAVAREAQLRAYQRVKHTGLVVTTDLYDWSEPGGIHPPKKQEVGRRLGLWALRDVYGAKDIEPCGPIYREMKIEGDKVRLFFDHAAGGLICPGGLSRSVSPIEGFMIAGEDRRFQKAIAEADGETVVVRGNDVRAPRYVRYGWDDFIPLSFYNEAGLPASPFRTDDTDEGKDGLSDDQKSGEEYRAGPSPR